MITVEDVISKGKTVIISFKDGNGEYHRRVKKFDTYKNYEDYCDTRMMQSGWKEIGTNIFTPKKNAND